MSEEELPMQVMTGVKQQPLAKGTENPSAKYTVLRCLLPLTIFLCAIGLMIGGFQFSNLRDWLLQNGKWTPLLFVLCGVAAMTMLIPKTAVSVSAGAIFGTFLGGFLMLVTAVAAAILNYSIARWWLHDMICDKLHREQTSTQKTWLQVMHDLATDAGFAFHLMVRLTPLPTTLISYTMGANGSRLKPFIAAAAVAVAPQLFWVQSGSATVMLAEGSTSIVHWAAVICSVTISVLASILLPRLAIHQIRMMKP